MRATCTKCGRDIYVSTAAHECDPDAVFEFMRAKLNDRRDNNERRERIAGLALAGMMADDWGNCRPASEITARCLEVADALIAALDKEDDRGD